ncbi:unnamed protein product [Ilex paraguariensis]|uniref:Uncharacterized protein n=1 Tax=Ilex paraguariensis TaxID=185542 RepID=A0ABC8RPJ2_9AQUA
MDLIWSHNGFPSASHFLVAVFFAFGFVAARVLLDRFIFRVSCLTVEIHFLPEESGSHSDERNLTCALEEFRRS